MPTVQKVAGMLGHGFRPVHLAAGQLLKHLLGLGHTFPDLRRVQLIYLWFDDGSVIANQHRREVKEFATLLGQDVVFLPMTYQVLFAGLETDELVEREYIADLRERYFAT
jgi:hypothetical protein